MFKTMGVRKRGLVFLCLFLVELLFSHDEVYCSPITVCSAEGIQRQPQVIPDGVGGTLMAWEDYRYTPTDVPYSLSIMSIYIQRIDADGSIHAGWPVDGVLGCYDMRPVRDFRSYFKLASDGDGGAIIVWNDFASARGGLGAQRIDKDGMPRWGSDGIGIRTLAWGCNFNIIPDGSGGVIIAFDADNVYPPSRGIDIFAQRVNSEGAILWPEYGVLVCTPDYNQRFPELVSDGSGGAVIAWTDSRITGGAGIYIQRIIASGTLLWTRDGVLVCDATGEETNPRLLADGTGGAFVTWEDYRRRSHDIYVQLVNKTGRPMWGPAGAPLCTDSGEQYKPQIAADGSGGAIVVWEDWRRSAGTIWCDIYVQRIARTGGQYFRFNGIPVCPSLTYGTGYGPKIAQDNYGGAFITWLDARERNSIFVQHMENTGNMLWGNGKYVGLQIHPVFGRPIDPHVFYSLEIVSDGYNAAFITWHDSRESYSPTGVSYDDYNIFAKRVE